MTGKNASWFTAVTKTQSVYIISDSGHSGHSALNSSSAQVQASARQTTWMNGEH